jgi:hypothetical protein
MVEALGTLSARPPTPPRTTTQVPSIDEKGRPEEHQTVFQTPGDSSFSTNGSTGALSSRRSKRVNFSPWTFGSQGPTPVERMQAVEIHPEDNTLACSRQLFGCGSL